MGFMSIASGYGVSPFDGSLLPQWWAAVFFLAQDLTRKNIFKVGQPNQSPGVNRYMHA
jgi:hypothetical protein